MNDNTLYIVTNNGTLIGIYCEVHEVMECMASLNNPFVEEFGGAPFGEY